MICYRRDRQPLGNKKRNQNKQKQQKQQHKQKQKLKGKHQQKLNESWWPKRLTTVGKNMNFLQLVQRPSLYAVFLFAISRTCD